MDYVKNEIDPSAQTGTRAGLAPIGHVVTVEGVQEVPINVTMQITFQEGYAWEDIEAEVGARLEEYLLELRKAWADSTELVVRVSQIEIRMLGINGVLDVTGTAINDAAQNFVLPTNSIPGEGEIHAAPD